MSFGSKSTPAPPNPPGAVLLIGPAQSAAAAAVQAELRAQGQMAQLATFEDARARLANSTEAPALLVIVEERPGEISPDAVAELRRLAPLAGVLGVTGTWCEGERRSGQPWTATLRWLWHQFPARWKAATAGDRHGWATAWQLPGTLTEEDRLALGDPRDGAPEPPATIEIVSLCPDTRAWLADACRAAGYHARQAGEPLEATAPTAAIPEGPVPADCILWDLSGEPEQLPEWLTIFAAAGEPPPRWIALVSFPRQDLIERLRRWGAAAVLAKPLLLEELEAVLRQGIARPLRTR